ncbi:type II toxin-antitoxin system YhaV family toxin [Rouxiella aceris]|uniref:type II toxin-antitoxin system YhaV family toxin n=1 Tax=Rouxiella aceris TaxID=2703884 RepID=UPI002E2B5BA9|nr:type II toxin-antitoxin system YhaV family toxin [Rouxiella aceris]
MNKRPAKLLAAISQVIERIALDPLGAHFLRGNTPGAENKHWFRAKFLPQYRLFFRYSNQYKTIVLPGSTTKITPSLPSPGRWDNLC